MKRLQSIKDDNGNIISDGSGASYSQKDCLWAVIWDAYKLDGTLLWRIKGGPGIILGNSSSFAIADFDGDRDKLRQAGIDMAFDGDTYGMSTKWKHPTLTLVEGDYHDGDAPESDPDQGFPIY